MFFELNKLLRVLKISTKNKYSSIKKLEDKNKGDRCFIIATGPSLKIEDLEKLENEITFSMNSICLAFELTKWRPTYLGIQDGKSYESMKKIIDNNPQITKLYSKSVEKHLDTKENTIIFPLNYGKHGSYLDEKFLTNKFSTDCYLEVIDGYTITYSLMQIAVFMGFKEIYLLGADSNFDNNKNIHFIEEHENKLDYSTWAERMINAYKTAAKYESVNTFRIFNATRGGALEEFERVDFDRVINEGLR